jgi:hypothetical protein
LPPAPSLPSAPPVPSLQLQALCQQQQQVAAPLNLPWGGPECTAPVGASARDDGAVMQQQLLAARQAVLQQQLQAQVRLVQNFRLGCRKSRSDSASVGSAFPLGTTH